MQTEISPAARRRLSLTNNTNALLLRLTSQSARSLTPTSSHRRRTERLELRQQQQEEYLEQQQQQYTPPTTSTTTTRSDQHCINPIIGFSSATATSLLPLTIMPTAALSNGSGSASKKRSSVLGAGRKVVAATVRRPLRTVGRFVGRGQSGHSVRSNSFGGNSDILHGGIVDDEEEDDLMEDGEGEEVMLREVHDEEEDDDDETETSTEIIVSSSNRPSLKDPHHPYQNQGGGGREGYRPSTRSLRSQGTDASSHRHRVLTRQQDPEWPVHTMERFLRTVLFVMVAYMVGASHPYYATQIARAAEYVLTAWGTCAGILVLAIMQRHFPNFLLNESSTPSASALSTMAMGPPLIAQVEFTSSSSATGQVYHGRGVGSGDDEEIVTERTALLGRRDYHDDDEEEVAEDGPQHHTPRSVKKKARSQHDISLGAAAVAAATDKTTLDTVESTDNDPNNDLPHPALTPFYVLDVLSGRRILPNIGEPLKLETEWFYCDMVCIIRTPDADDPTAPVGTPASQKTSDYLRPKQRRFEFQFQCKLKKKPTGKAIYFACHLDEAIKMGVIQRAFVGAAMAFVKTSNPTFHYSIQGSKPTPDGKWEKPCMSFTAEGSLDRLVVTKAGDPVPALGGELYENPESLKYRKKGGLVDWNTEDTYTMALWSAYVDFLDWRVINLPGIRPFNLSSILGQQCINLTLYVIDENRGTDKHYQKDIETIVHFELSNERSAALGPAARKWAKNRFRPKKRQSGDDKLNMSMDIDTLPVLVDDRSRYNDENTTNIKSAAASAKLIESPTNPESGLSKSTEAFDDVEDADQDADQDAATAAKLGEGIYLKSGDKVVLREYVMDGGEDGHKNSVTNGGGFVVLQNQDATIIIEKARNSRRNRLIKTGDAVLFKMVQKKGEDTEIRYLSIHRGWWLKWVSSAPSKNGYFTIYTHDSEVNQQGDRDKTVRSVETQSAYLTVGGSFTLRHKRWSKYHVGVASEPSPTYGGRMLGLYHPSSHKGGNKATEEQYHSDEDAAGNDLGDGPEMTDDGSSTKDAPWMKPLVLSAHEPSTVTASYDTSPLDSANPNPMIDYEVGGDHVGFPEKITFSSEHCQLDVPAWIEMMNRTERVPHLSYVVRVTQKGVGSAACDSRTAEEPDALESNSPADPLVLARLRTGRDLAQIMRVGQTHAAIWAKAPAPKSSASPFPLTTAPKVTMRGRRPSEGTPTQAFGKSNSYRTSFQTSPTQHLDGTSTPPKRDGTLSLSPRLHVTQSARVPLDFAIDNDSESEEESVAELADDAEVLEEYEAEVLSSDEREPGRDTHEPSKGAVQKGREILGKVAKTAKTATVVTGKTAVKTVVGTGKLTAKAAIGTGKLTAKAAVGTGKLTGKVAVGTGKTAVRASKKVAGATVNAGKAITMTAGKAVIAPVTRKSKQPPKQEPKQKKKDRDLRVAVTKTMRKIERLENKASRYPTVLAGELCAPEQSCRTASRVISRMSSLPPTSPIWAKANNVLTSQLSASNEQDKFFLTGNSVQMGVTPLAGDQSRGALHHESVVARCLWESHWCEEWCGMYETCLSFYAPMTKAPSLEIAYVDVQNVRPLDAGYLAPLPGFPLLVLETPWLCHYIAFRDEEARDTFGEKVEDAIANHVKQVEESANIQESDLRKARFWQGLQSLSESSLSSGRGKWAPISSSQKLKHRTILNGRRMVFDLHTDMTDGYAFVEEVTTAALSFSLDSLENDPDSFIDFLDAISHLRLLPLEEIDFTNKDAFCLFVNLYHCLLQHAMLLSVNGPVEKRSVAHFMRTASYEIGGDVFSLAELHCCVIRGKMSRPLNPKPPYIEAPKKSNAHRFYALDYTDARVNFVLNTGDVACPSSVPVLRAFEVDSQLNTAASIFLKNQLYIDTNRRFVVLPKVCEVYKNDFGPDPLSCLKFCLGGLDEGTASTIRVMMMDESTIVIRYQHTAEHYHTCLKLREGAGVPMATLLGALHHASD